MLEWKDFTRPEPIDIFQYPYINYYLPIFYIQLPIMNTEPKSVEQKRSIKDVEGYFLLPEKYHIFAFCDAPSNFKKFTERNGDCILFLDDNKCGKKRDVIEFAITVGDISIINMLIQTCDAHTLRWKYNQDTIANFTKNQEIIDMFPETPDIQTIIDDACEKSRNVKDAFVVACKNIFDIKLPDENIEDENIEDVSIIIRKAIDKLIDNDI